MRKLYVALALCFMLAACASPPPPKAIYPDKLTAIACDRTPFLLAAIPGITFNCKVAQKIAVNCSYYTFNEFNAPMAVDKPYLDFIEFTVDVNDYKKHVCGVSFDPDQSLELIRRNDPIAKSARDWGTRTQIGTAHVLQFTSSAVANCLAFTKPGTDTHMNGYLWSMQGVYCRPLTGASAAAKFSTEEINQILAYANAKPDIGTPVPGDAGAMLSRPEARPG